MANLSEESSRALVLPLPGRFGYPPPCTPAPVDGDALAHLADGIIDLVARLRRRNASRCEFWPTRLDPGADWQIGLRWWGELACEHADVVTAVAYRYRGPFRQGSDWAYWFAGVHEDRLVPLRRIGSGGEALLDLDRSVA